MIIGTNSGAGKSTFARLLGEKLEISPSYLDAFFWKPGWEISTFEEMSLQIKAVLDNDRWIIEGNYTKHLFEERVKLADTIFLFDFNRFVCFYYAIKRRIMYHNKVRPCIAPGCKEKFDLEFAKWILYKAPKTWKPVRELVNNIKGKKVVVFYNRKQVNEYLLNIQGET